MPARRTVQAWRSGLEESVGASLQARDVDFQYETRKLKWMPVTKMRTYTPDYWIYTDQGTCIVVETKGYFTVADRQKMLCVRDQHPGLDIRFVFSNPNQKIRKGSKTSYGDWCTANGFKFAKGDVPDAWLEE